MSTKQSASRCILKCGTTFRVCSGPNSTLAAHSFRPHAGDVALGWRLGCADAKRDAGLLLYLLNKAFLPATRNVAQTATLCLV